MKSKEFSWGLSRNHYRDPSLHSLRVACRSLNDLPKAFGAPPDLHFLSKTICSSLGGTPVLYAQEFWDSLLIPSAGDVMVWARGSKLRT